MSSDVSLLDLSEPRSVKMFRPRMAQRVEVFTQCKGFLESGVQGNFVCGIRKTVQGVRNPSNDWNPESKFHYQRLEYSTWNLRRGIQNTRVS